MWYFAIAFHLFVGPPPLGDVTGMLARIQTFRSWPATVAPERVPHRPGMGHPPHPLGTGTSRSGRPDGRLPHGGRSREGRSRQDRWADDWAWTVSWMSMNRIDQYPGRGSGSSCRDQKNPANVTAAAASQMITPTPRIHGVDPNDSTMRPAMVTASPTYPTRRAQTATLQCPLYCSSGG